MNLLLDTTVLIDVLRGRAGVQAALVDAIDAGHVLGTSAVNVAEVYSGVRGNEESIAREFLASLRCFPLTASIAARGGQLRNDWARRGTSLGLADTLIAATALEHRLHLVTDNRKDFPMPELLFFTLV